MRERGGITYYTSAWLQRWTSSDGAPWSTATMTHCGRRWRHSTQPVGKEEGEGGVANQWGDSLATHRRWTHSWLRRASIWPRRLAVASSLPVSTSNDPPPLGLTTPDYIYYNWYSSLVNAWKLSGIRLTDDTTCRGSYVEDGCTMPTAMLGSSFADNVHCWRNEALIDTRNQVTPYFVTTLLVMVLLCDLFLIYIWNNVYPKNQ